MSYITFPEPNTKFNYKVYEIKIDDNVVKKVVGAPKALKVCKYYKYSNFKSSVSFTNYVTKKIVKQFN